MRRSDFLRLAGASAVLPWLAGSVVAREPFADLSVGTFNPELAPQLAAAGYGHLELSVTNDLMPARSAADFEAHLAKLRALPVTCRMMNGFYSGERKMVGPDADPDFFVGWSRTAFPRAAKAGVRIVTVGAGRARKVPAGFDPARAREQFSACLARILPVATDHGVTLAIENLNSGETNLGNSIAECLGIIEATGPAMRLTADLYHMLRDGDRPEALRVAMPRLVHCHVAERERRTPPGTAGDDFRPFLKVLREGGYAGAYSFECGWGQGRATPAEAIRAFREQLRTC